MKFSLSLLPRNAVYQNFIMLDFMMNFEFAFFVK